MKRRKGMFFISMGLLLLAAALVLTVYNIYDNVRAKEAAGTVLSELQSELEKKSGATDETSIRNDEGDEKEGILIPDREMPAIEIDGYRYIGILKIPSLKLELPIMEECDETRLKIAPCRYYGSVYRDNMVIAGHNYRSHFSKLKSLPLGSEICFIDVEKNEFYYSLGWIDILGEDDAEAMCESGAWDLTLFTCTYGGKERYTLRLIREKDKNQ